MEKESLLAKQRDEKAEAESEQQQQHRVTWNVFSEEIKRICHIAGPMVAVTSSQYLLQVVSTMIVGHLGELYLSSASLAISFAAVTGFSFLVRKLYIPHHSFLILPSPH
ncbi:isoflavonoid efflux MATE transporter [Sesbania bispinosa]|nr:isoflavonoid efflux MATE transporter [Sesbania bispinosa]